MTVAATASTPPPSRTGTPRHKNTSNAINGSESGRRPSRSASSASLDPLSDRATLTLIRRTLCSQQLKDKGRDALSPIEDLLPPLTSRNDVDLQLYAFLAIIMREFVQSWYGKITNDETFVAEIVAVIAHCTRALEQRLKRLDLESLLFDELPDLLDRHATAYRTAFRSASPQGFLQVDPHEIYHSLCPLPALSPVPRADVPTTVALQQENEIAYRQLLVRAVLAILLPTEDLENPCLTAIVSQILSELIIGNTVAKKASQPWLLYEAICIVARPCKEKDAVTGRRAMASSKSTLSSFDPKTPEKTHTFSIQTFVILLIRAGIMLFTVVRLFVRVLADAVQLPPRVIIAPDGAEEADDDMPSATKVDKNPIFAFKIWPFVANLISLDEKKPWLGGILSLIQTVAVRGPGRIARLNGPLDRLLSHHIQSLFDPSVIPPVLRSLRGALFPNNNPGTSSLVAPSSAEELAALRHRAARAVSGLLPKSVTRAYFGGRLWRRGGSHDDDAKNGDGEDDDSKEEEKEYEDMVDEVEKLLMILDDEYCNKHLMYSVLELVLVRLMPEMTEKGVVELWEDRLGLMMGQSLPSPGEAER